VEISKKVKSKRIFVKFVLFILLSMSPPILPLGRVVFSSVSNDCVGLALEVAQRDAQLCSYFLCRSKFGDTLEDKFELVEDVLRDGIGASLPSPTLRSL
jgi:hypothetical protein